MPNSARAKPPNVAAGCRNVMATLSPAACSKPRLPAATRTSVAGTGKQRRDAEIARRALKAVGLADFEDRDVQTLSGGERQRLAIATLLTQGPPLYLLDEPLAHLDLNHQIAVLDLFAGAAKDCGAGVIMVLHEPGLADRYCDRALLIHGDGRTELGSCREMLTAPCLTELYGHPLKEVESDGHRWFIPC